jgi:hypothetical protein
MVRVDEIGSVRWIRCQAVACHVPFHAEALGLLHALRWVRTQEARRTNARTRGVHGHKLCATGEECRGAEYK